MTNLFSHDKLNHLISVALDKGCKIILILLLYVVLHKLGTILISRSFKQYREKSRINNTRLITLEKLSLNIYHYTLIFFIVYSVLSIFGVPVESLLAGAGIVGIAIGFAAQGIIGDFITGFFIILERQLEVGDYVYINTIEGTVESVGLRTTTIKSPDGTVNFIPNRTITVVRNSSREDMRVLIDIHVPADIDIQKAHQVLKETTKAHQNDYKDIKGNPDILGFTTLPNGQYVLRVQMFVNNGAQGFIQREFLAYYIEALKQANIEVLPSPLPLIAK